MTITALALFSGGLDSMLACRVVAQQGIAVQAIKFVTPFFGYELLAREEEYCREVKEKYDITLKLHDLSVEYLQMLRQPANGYGKHFNPCIDCKILMLTTARELLPKYNASFIITGEVVGQRPMSQRRDTLALIERQSGCKPKPPRAKFATGAEVVESILVRPLCAQLQPPSKPELEGLIDRQQLLRFSGRSRTDQMALAAHFGITDYPSPAGGCVLTDSNLAARVRKYYADTAELSVADIRLLLVGRHLRLPHGGWLVMGRNEKENNHLAELRSDHDDWLTFHDQRSGPWSILRYADHPQDRQIAAGLMIRYGYKGESGVGLPGEISFRRGGVQTLLAAEPLLDPIVQSWLC